MLNYSLWISISNVLYGTTTVIGRKENRENTMGDHWSELRHANSWVSTENLAFANQEIRGHFQSPKL